MRAELRPSSLGEILDRTAQMYRSHFLLYFGIASIAYAATLVLSLIADVLIFSHPHADPRVFARIRIGVGGSLGILTLLPVAIGMAAVMHAVARNYLGEMCTIRETYVSIGRRWYRYILILLAMYCYALLPIAILIGITIVPAVSLHAGTSRGVAIGLMVVMMLAGMCTAFWWMLRWALSIPASLMENLKVHRALKRSSVLTKGGIGRIFVMLLLVGAVMTLIQYAIQTPMFILLWKSKGVPTLTTQIEAAAPKDLPTGLGKLTSVILGHEVCDWKRFTNRREVSSYTGLCPGEYSSGDKRRQGSVTKHGNPRLRAALVE